MKRDEFIEKWNLRSVFISPLFLIDLQEVINEEKDEVIKDHLRFQKDSNIIYKKMKKKMDEDIKVAQECGSWDLSGYIHYGEQKSNDTWIPSARLKWHTRHGIMVPGDTTPSQITTLQQLWRNITNGKEEWRDIPMENI